MGIKFRLRGRGQGKMKEGRIEGGLEK